MDSILKQLEDGLKNIQDWNENKIKQRITFVDRKGNVEVKYLTKSEFEAERKKRQVK